MRTFLKQLLSDETGNYSSKRLAGLLCVLSLVIALLGNTFYPKSIHPSDSLVEAIALFAFGALGLTSIDKFSRKKSN
jgi:hypothetical protein